MDNQILPVAKAQESQSLSDGTAFSSMSLNRAVDDSVDVHSSASKRFFDGIIAGDQKEQPSVKIPKRFEGTMDNQQSVASSTLSNDRCNTNTDDKVINFAIIMNSLCQNGKSTSSDGKSPSSSTADSPKPLSTPTSSSSSNTPQPAAESVGEEERLNSSDLNSEPKQNTTSEQEQGCGSGSKASLTLPQKPCSKQTGGSGYFYKMVNFTCQSVYREHGIPSTKPTTRNSLGHPVVQFPMLPTIKPSLTRRPTRKSTICQGAVASTSRGPDAFPDFKFDPCTNPTELFLKIRKQVQRKRNALFAVQPKAPAGFKDYLLNRRTYTLAGNTAEPVINAPPIVPSYMEDLYVSQEMARYKLRMQHIVEKEKLVLCAEQEIIRVHGRAARALVNQPYPFSVCTFLMDEEVYNLKTPDQEARDRLPKEEFNNREFVQSLKDLDDKWKTLRLYMLRRQRNEAESLHAAQRLAWTWQMRDLGLIGRHVNPKKEDEHVPLIVVEVYEDDFLPD